jgi:hypothetical protein
MLQGPKSSNDWKVKRSDPSIVHAIILSSLYEYHCTPIFAYPDYSHQMLAALVYYMLNVNWVQRPEISLPFTRHQSGDGGRGERVHLLAFAKYSIPKMSGAGMAQEYMDSEVD